MLSVAINSKENPGELYSEYNFDNYLSDILLDLNRGFKVKEIPKEVSLFQKSGSNPDRSNEVLIQFLRTGERPAN